MSFCAQIEKQPSQPDYTEFALDESIEEMQMDSEADFYSVFGYDTIQHIFLPYSNKSNNKDFSLRVRTYKEKYLDDEPIFITGIIRNLLSQQVNLSRDPCLECKNHGDRIMVLIGDVVDKNLMTLHLDVIQEWENIFVINHEDNIDIETGEDILMFKFDLTKLEDFNIVKTGEYLIKWRWVGGVGDSFFRESDTRKIEVK